MGNDRLLYWYLYDIDVNLSTPQILPRKCFVVLSKASLQLSDHRLNSLWMCSIVAFTRYSLVDYNKEYLIIYRKNYFAKQNDFSHRLLFVLKLYYTVLMYLCSTWLILPVVICLSQRLSHACLSINNYTVKLRMAH